MVYHKPSKNYFYFGVKHKSTIEFSKYQQKMSITWTAPPVPKSVQTQAVILEIFFILK